MDKYNEDDKMRVPTKSYVVAEGEASSSDVGVMDNIRHHFRRNWKFYAGVLVGVGLAAGVRTSETTLTYGPYTLVEKTRRVF